MLNVHPACSLSNVGTVDEWPRWRRASSKKRAILSDFERCWTIFEAFRLDFHRISEEVSKLVWAINGAINSQKQFYKLIANEY